MLPSSVLRSVGDRIGGALLLATRAGSLGGEWSSLHFRREVNCGFQSRAGRARVLKTPLVRASSAREASFSFPSTSSSSQFPEKMCAFFPRMKNTPSFLFFLVLSVFVPFGYALALQEKSSSRCREFCLGSPSLAV
jgi:hypothetical protein